jgi:hypothetical protein
MLPMSIAVFSDATSFKTKRRVCKEECFFGQHFDKPTEHATTCFRGRSATGPMILDELIVGPLGYVPMSRIIGNLNPHGRLAR